MLQGPGLEHRTSQPEDWSLCVELSLLTSRIFKNRCGWRDSNHTTFCLGDRRSAQLSYTHLSLSKERQPPQDLAHLAPVSCGHHTNRRRRSVVGRSGSLAILGHMRTCVVCGDRIPWQVEHEGQKRKLGPREKCLVCLPYRPSTRGATRGWRRCGNCDSRFKSKQKIGGKVVNLEKRSYCLICQPLGKHFQPTLDAQAKTRSCADCGLAKPVVEYQRVSRRTGKIILGESRCCACRAKEQRDNKRALKQQCVDYKGGACEVETCGYSRCIEALSFHHTDPAQKDFSVSQVHYRVNAFERIRAELDKCRLLCRNCHAEEHARIRDSLSAEEVGQAPS